MEPSWSGADPGDELAPDQPHPLYQRRLLKAQQQGLLRSGKGFCKAAVIPRIWIWIEAFLGYDWMHGEVSVR